MLYLLNEREGQEVHDSRLNIATTHYVVNELRLDQPAIHFSIHQPTVMIGRYQNAYAEVDQAYLEDHDITLLRRLSGGGAVYHDEGNIMFMLTGPDDGRAGQKRYAEYSAPILEAIRALGVEGVEASGRNDLTIQGLKFAGTSFYSHLGHFMFGATLSYDLDVGAAERVLRPNQTKLKAHRSKSVKGRMTNIKDHLPEAYQSWSTPDFRDYLARSILGVEDLAQAPVYRFTDEDWARIDQVKEEWFANPEWNWGQRSDFKLETAKRFASGTYEFQAEIDQGIIQEAKLYGDYFAKNDPQAIADGLRGLAFQPQAIRQATQDLDFESFIEGFSQDQLIELIFERTDDDD